MRRRTPTRIGELMGDFFASTPHIARKIAEAKIDELWLELVGDVIAGYTTELVIKDGRLLVKMSSSVARSEVFLRRESLKEAINKASKMQLITTIIVK